MSENMSETAIELKNISIAYRDVPVVQRLSVGIPLGKLVAIVGPNGAGKSTLLKAIVGLVKPLEGSISIFGQSLHAVQQLIAYVPQRMSVDWDFPVSVLDVVLMGCYAKLKWFKRPGAQEKMNAFEALSQVGMESFAHRHISELSGGQQQRVFLARALMQQAKIYILDEPFAGVDMTSEKKIIEVLTNLRLQGNTIIVVHHDLQTLMEYFDWVMLMNMSAVAYGPVKDVLKPEFMCQAYGNRTIFQLHT